MTGKARPAIADKEPAIRPALPGTYPINLSAPTAVLELVVLFVVVLAVRRAVLLTVLAILIGFVFLILVVLILTVLVAVLIIILRHNLFPPVSLGYKSIIFFLPVFYTFIF